MWGKAKSRENKNNRIKFVVMLIFLASFFVIVKLFFLQVKNHEAYAERARNQQQIETVLLAKRGKILVQAKKDDESSLYPLATNKDFAFVYTVPTKVKKPVETAQTMYEIFHRVEIEQEIKNKFKEEDEQKIKDELKTIVRLPSEEKEKKRQEILARYDGIFKDPQFIASRTLEIQQLIEEQKKLILERYLTALMKENDPYEPLEPKIDEEKLKTFYLAMLPFTDYATIFGIFGSDLGKQEIDSLIKDLTLEKLEMKNGSIVADIPEDAKGRTRKWNLNLDGIGFTLKTYRFYPEKNIGANLLGLVKTETNKGAYGLEGFFDSELKGKDGYLNAEKGAMSGLIIMDGQEYIKPQNGSDLILTIDQAIQFFACKKLDEAVKKHEASGGSIIVLEPQTGSILAMCSEPDFDPNEYAKEKDISVFNNPVVFDQYEPGSIMKTITLVSALDQGKITPFTTYQDDGFIMINGWKKPIKNSDYGTHGGHGITTMRVVLEQSLNTGAIFAMRQIGRESFAQYLQEFGFGQKTGIELEGEGTGNLNPILGPKVPEIYPATASFGQGITVTPLQAAMAYSALANKGILMKPILVKEIIHPDGSKEVIQPKQLKKVVSENATNLISGMLANVVEVGHSKTAGVSGYYVGAKTGTAQAVAKGSRVYGSATIHTVAGYAPIEEPKFVLLTKINNPKDVEYAEGSAAHLFHDIAEFLLNYWQVPKEREEKKR